MIDNAADIFAYRIKTIRLEMGLSQKNFSLRLGLPFTTYTNYEYGLSEVTIGNLAHIARELHVSMDWLAGLSSCREIGDLIYE